MNVKYIIIEDKDITKDIIECSLNSSYDDLRFNNDGTKAIMKFNTLPSCIQGYVKYDCETIITQLEVSEWSKDETYA